MIKTRKEKIRFLSGIRSGRINPTKEKKTLSIVAFYPGLRKQAYQFINGQRVTPEAWEAEFTRQKSQGIQPVTETYIGPLSRNCDPLPEFFKQYLDDETK